MNSKRIYFQLPESHQYRITPYWFLGFVEGEGSFFIKTKDLKLTFNIGQADIDLALMKEIKDFLKDLPGAEKYGKEKSSLVNFSISQKTKDQHKNFVLISISHMGYIRNVLIPFFNSLTWRSKKQYDFKDWQIISQLIDKGFHYTEEGLSCIKLIVSQLNNRRFTAEGNPSVDRTLLEDKIRHLLSGPSNYDFFLIIKKKAAELEERGW
jgi:hypothetical protein